MKIFKPTSIIFLIVASALIVVGAILCIVGYSIADKQDILLFSESLDKDGTPIVERTFSRKSIKKASFDFEKCDVYVIGGTEKSGIELYNFTESEFEYSVTNSELTLKNSSIFSAFHINESGSNFSGLRHYLAIPFYSGKTKKVEIYIPKDFNSITGFNINVKKGNIYIENVDLNSNYSINIENGDVSIKNTKSSGTCDAIIENGNLYFDSNDILGTIVNINKNGNIYCSLNAQHSLTCECENGVVYLDQDNIGKKYQGTYPAKIIKEKEKSKKIDEKSKSKNTENTETEDNAMKLPNTFFAKVKRGDIKIRYLDS